LEGRGEKRERKNGNKIDDFERPATSRCSDFSSRWKKNRLASKWDEICGEQNETGALENSTGVINSVSV